jgi:hypothetical protein
MIKDEENLIQKDEKLQMKTKKRVEKKKSH